MPKLPIHASRPENFDLTRHTLLLGSETRIQIGSSATLVNSTVSTPRSNAENWAAVIYKSPVSEWELTLLNPDEVKKHFLSEEINDILFVVAYAGHTLEWVS